MNFTDSRTYAEAADDCTQRGSYLASILSPFLPQLFIFPNTSYWIGLQDLHTNGTFQWIDGSSVDFLNFDSTEMNRTECVVGNYEGSEYWGYADCDSTQYYFCSAGG